MYEKYSAHNTRFIRSCLGRHDFVEKKSGANVAKLRRRDSSPSYLAKEIWTWACTIDVSEVAEGSQIPVVRSMELGRVRNEY